MWVTESFYKDEYRLGSPGVIPEEQFAFWEARAVETINFKKVEVDDPPEYLKLCVCAVAEILYQAEQAPKAGETISESIGSYNYKVQDGRPTSDVHGDIRAAIKKYLEDTDLHNVLYSRKV